MKKIYKIALFVMALSIFLSFTVSAYALEPKLGVSEEYRNSKFYSQLIAVDDSSGDQRQLLVDIAESQNGYHEGKSKNDLSGISNGTNNFTEYGRAMATNGVPWCAYFISWCARQGGIESIETRSTAGNGFANTWYSWSDIANGRYVPQPGDLINIHWAGNKDTYSHVGIIENFTKLGNNSYQFQTIEGNADNSVTKKSRIVNANGVLSWSNADDKIVSIVVPDYSNSVATSSNSSQPLTPPTLSIRGQNAPDKLKSKESFGIRGTIQTDYGNVTEVHGMILDNNGNVIQQSDKYPNSKSLDLRYSINNDLIFNKLADGTYTYRVTAKAVNGNNVDEKTLIEQRFTVGTGTGNISAERTSKPVVFVNGNNVTVSWNYDGNATGFDVYLVQDPWNWEAIKYNAHVGADARSYTFNNVADGYYNAFTVARPNDDSVQSEWAEVLGLVGSSQTYSVTYLLNGGNGNYDTIEYKAGEQVTISSVKPIRDGYTFVQWWDGTNVHNPGDTFIMPDSNINLTAEWKKNIKEPLLPNISIIDETIPENLNVGDNFGIRGIISTDYGVITEVWGAILDSNGNVIQQGSYYPNEKSHNLRYSINNDLIFGSLAAGTYKYKVRAQGDNDGMQGYAILIEKTFVVGDGVNGDYQPPHISISEHNMPSNHQQGKNFGIRGIVSTDYGVITKVYGAIYDSNGNVVQSELYYPNEQSHNLRYSINNDLIFNSLPVGTYFYRVHAEAVHGDKTATVMLIYHEFTVS